jgi:transglutaminase-like putative cysteine protease
MKTILSLILLVNFTKNNVVAQQYAASQLPTSLTEKASTVVRFNEEKIIIKNPGNAIVKRKYAYTILNASGDKHANFVVHYDKLSPVSDITGTLYDGNGNKIRSLKKNEVKDYSNTSEISLVDDNRVKVHNFNHSLYPYTVEYEYEEEMKGIFYLPGWVPIFDENVAVEKSNFIVEAPADYVLRYKEFNLQKTGPQITDIKNNKSYSWELKNTPAVIDEIYSAPRTEITPSVLLAPASYEIQKYSGTMNNWKEFGLFMNQLNFNRDQLPANVKQTVHQLTHQLTNEKDKVAILYRYLQKNTRYISIQLGLGGWQTLDANFVATNGYGDCKALTNYMYSLLKEAGIKSMYSLIKAGEGQNSFVSDFSSNQFNHVILCVPQPKDTIWLECTSQTLQPGYLSGFTSNRPVLLIDENGGTLARTPNYAADVNLQIRNITAGINEEGLLTASIKTKYQAEQQDGLYGLLKQGSQSNITEHVKTKFRIAPSYDVNKFTHDIGMYQLPYIDESIEVTARSYASVSGKRMFITPNITSVSSIKISDAATRKYDFNLSFAFTDYDTVKITIPAGYTPESMPSAVSVKMPLAEYRSAVKVEASQIIYTRYYKQTTGSIKAADINVAAQFFDKIYKADRARIVFVKENK